MADGALQLDSISEPLEDDAMQRDDDTTHSGDLISQLSNNHEPSEEAGEDLDGAEEKRDDGELPPPDDGPLPFGQWLRMQRKRLGITQKELAELSHCTTVMLRKIEAGERRPSSSNAKRIAVALHILPEDRDAFVTYARLGPKDLRRVELPGWLKGQLSYPMRKLSNLPPQVKTIVGRTAEIEKICAHLLSDDMRGIVLHGPVGVGKTRLALEVAQRLQSSFPHGAFLIDLKNMRAPDQIAELILNELGLPLVGSLPIRGRLSSMLYDKQLLLVLDSFEDAMPARTLIADMLRLCPGLKFIVTSRVRVCLIGEDLLALKPLRVPVSTLLPSLYEPDAPEAIQLFMERARSVNPNFTVDDEAMVLIAKICQRCDGLPLAIELLAAYMRSFTPKELLRHLNGRFLLTIGSEDPVISKEGVFLNALRASYDRLSEHEKYMLTSMIAMVDGGTIEAIGLTAAENTTLPSNLFHAFMALVDKSLIVRVDFPDRTMRYTMLQIVRDFCIEELLKLDEVSANVAIFRERHAQIYFKMAENAEKQIRNIYERKWFERLNRDFENLSASLRLLVASDINATDGLVLISRLWWFWQRRGLVKEGRAWIDRVLRRSDYLRKYKALKRTNTLKWSEKQKLQAEAIEKNRTIARGLALQGSGFFAWIQGEYSRAEKKLMISRRIMKALKANSGIAYSTMYLGLVYLSQGEPKRARYQFEQCMNLFVELKDTWGIGMTYRSLGLAAAAEKDFKTALLEFERGLTVFQRLGETWGTVIALNDLGTLALWQNNRTQAEELYMEGFKLIDPTKDPWLAATLQYNLSALECQRGDYAVATTHAGAVLKIWRDLGNKPGLGMTLFLLGKISFRQGQSERAVRLFGAADAIFSTMIRRATYFGQEEDKACIEALRDQLGSNAFRVAWGEGKNLEREEALNYALRFDESEGE